VSGRFEGRRVLVTGASRGLGRSVAVAFAREGAHLGIGCRVRQDEATATLAGVLAAGGTGDVLRFDVRDPAAVAREVERFASAGLDVLVNNAAVVRDQLFVLLESEEWDEVVDVGLAGVYRCCRAALPFMLSRRRGAIVNVASIAGVRASPGQASYSAAKGGVVALTATLAAELAPRGIRVNSVVPGLLSTGMGERLDHRAVAGARARIPLGRLGTGDEAARAVIFLASDEASYVVGHCLVVDGGLSL
jgi:3-oxoacyl-[acyl-carrier protein] reductase